MSVVEIGQFSNAAAFSLPYTAEYSEEEYEMQHQQG